MVRTVGHIAAVKQDLASAGGERLRVNHQVIVSQPVAESSVEIDFVTGGRRGRVIALTSDAAASADTFSSEGT